MCSDCGVLPEAVVGEHQTPQHLEAGEGLSGQHGQLVVVHLQLFQTRKVHEGAVVEGGDVVPVHIQLSQRRQAEEHFALNLRYGVLPEIHCGQVRQPGKGARLQGSDLIPLNLELLQGTELESVWEGTGARRPVATSYKLATEYTRTCKVVRLAKA